MKFSHFAMSSRITVRSAGLIHMHRGLYLQCNQVLLKLVLLKGDMVPPPIFLEPLPFLMGTKMIFFFTFFLSALLLSFLHYCYFYLTRIVLFWEFIFLPETSPTLSYPTEKFKQRRALLSSIIHDFSFEHVILLFCYNADQRGPGPRRVFSSSFQLWTLKK